MSSKVTYHQQISFCGKPRCRKCSIGVGHGPYWYAYSTVNGRTTRTYIGKRLPPDVQPEQVQTWIAERPAQESDPAMVRISMLGRFELERRSGRSWQSVEEGPWRHQRQRTLLALLLNSPGRKLGREQIMEALWPDLEPETAAARLDRAVHSLRKVLEPSLPRLAASRLLRSEHEGLALADQREIWVDSDAFESLLAQAHDEQRSAAEREQLLEEAAALYVSDLLPEMEGPSWLQLRREVLRRNWMGLLLELADLRLARQAFAAVIEPLDRLLAADDTNEAAVQRLIIALTALGRRAEAMRAYHRLTEALQRSYGIAPLQETSRLYEEARRGAINVSNLPAVTPVPPAVPPSFESGFYDGRESRPHVQIGRTHQSPLIGREREMDTLRQVLTICDQQRRARLGNRRRTGASLLDAPRQPQCVLLAGEAGIGKTRLAEELGREAQQQGWAIAWSRVYAQESSVPYRPWTEVLRNAQSRGFWQTQEISRRPLLYQPLSVLLPELNALPRVEFLTPLSPEDEQRRLWEAMLDLLTTISERAPLLIVIDDLHWADASSCELLAYLVRHLQQRPIMLIGTYRDTELPAEHPLRTLLPHLQREQAALRLGVEPLSDEQIASLVAHLPEPLVHYVQEKAGGNPFFAEELARTLEGVSGQSGRGPNRQPATMPLPDTIAAVLDLRMGRLSSPCQRLLSNASVLEGAFEFNEILQMEAAGGSTLDEATLLELLEEALHEGVLVEEGTGTRISYHFWHPLLGLHLYERLSAARRASLHRRAAAVLQRKYAGREAEGAATITNHLVKGGGDAATTARYAELAGDQAYTLSAYGEAEGYYRLAIQYLQEARPRSLEAWSPQERLHLADLMELLAYCLRARWKSQEARPFYERVLALHSQDETPPSEDEARYEAQYRAMIWGEIGWTWYLMGDNVHARECSERAEHLLREAGVERSPAWASIRRLQGYIDWQDGNYHTAFEEARAALAMFEEMLDHPELRLDLPATGRRLTHVNSILAGDPVDPARTHRLIGSIANSVGRREEALAHLNIALTKFEQHNCFQEIAYVCCNMGHAYLNSAQYKLAQAAFRRSLHLAENLSNNPLRSIIFGNLGILASRSGDLLEAEAWFERCIQLVETINDQVYLVTWHTYLSDVYLNRGEISKAEQSVMLALKTSKAIKNIPCFGSALIALATLHITNYLTTHPGRGDPLTASQSNGRSPLHRKHMLLHRAKTLLQRALNFDELEEDKRTEGSLALAHTLLLLGSLKEAEQQASSTLAEAQRHELLWEQARAEQLLGTILAAQRRYEAAARRFERALQILQSHDMRLDYARTIHSYGAMLLQQRQRDQQDRQRGLDYLREARRIFAECHAALDLQAAEQLLRRYTRLR
jgi:DNA-binding SARP family transcriptional activator/tetratricopeptide (TPR) repeat protein